MNGFIIAIVALMALLGGGAWWFLRTARRRTFAQSLSYALYLIKIPRSRNATPDAYREDIVRFEQLVANLGSVRAPVVFETAVPHVGEEIHFYVAVPRVASEVVAKQIQALWSGASVSRTEGDYNIFNPTGAVAGAYLMHKAHYAVPFRTYTEITTDTFASIIGAFTKIDAVGEGAALQVIIAPAENGAQKPVQAMLHALKKGESFADVLGADSAFGMLKGALAPKTEEEKAKDAVVDGTAVRALESKIAKPLFAVNIRVLTSGVTPFQANDILNGLLSGFTQLAAPMRNEVKAVKPKNPQELVRQFSFRLFDPQHALILNSEEIASIYHLPTSQTETPKVKWLKSKEAAPPSHMPSQGIRLGVSAFRGDYKPVLLSPEDRRRHVYVVGQTGTGKSTLLGNLILADIEAGHGVCLIDPHGDLAEAALGAVPKNRIDDVIYFNPGDLERPMGLNMLEYNPARPEEKTFIVNELQGIFNKLFPPETMGPMFEQYMRNALLLLMEDMHSPGGEPATLIEVPRVMSDPEYRKRKLERIHNPVVLDFWQKEAAKAGGDASLANMTPYITSKFSNFIANDYMRPIIGQPKSAFSFREVMDSGKVLLVNLSKGRTGDINASLLGMIITGKLLMSSLSRVDTDQSQRKDFYLYIDEFQNFTTDSIATILSEARKYRLNLTVAHQFIAQLTERTKDAVFGNVGSQVVFRVGVQDAEFLVKQFEPTFDQNDLISIDNLNAYARILVDGQTTSPFNMIVETTSWNKGDRVFADKLREYSRLKYGAERESVENAIRSRLRN